MHLYPTFQSNLINASTTQNVHHETNGRSLHIQVTRDYHMITMMKTYILKQAHPLLFFSLDLRALFCTSTCTSKFLIALLIVHNEGNQCFSLMYTMHANASNYTPLYTHMWSTWTLPNRYISYDIK